MKNKKLRIRNKKLGFTLLETLVALAILASAFLGPLTLASYSLRSASYARNQTIAFYLAQEAIEYIRNRRDSNNLDAQDWFWQLNECVNSDCCIDATASFPNDIKNIGNPDCSHVKYNSSSGLYGHNGSWEDTIFTRTVRIDQPFNGRDYEARITVTLSWLERFGTKSFSVQEHVFNWKL